MSVVPKANASVAFELKSAALTLIALVLKTTDLAVFAAEFSARFAGAPDLFDGDPVALDLSQVSGDDRPIDFATLIDLLHSFHLAPIAVRGGSEGQMQAAYAAGLIDAPDGVPARPRDEAPVLREVVSATEPEAEAEPEPEAEDEPAAAAPVAAPAPARTLVVDRPLRSGQQVYARGSDLVLMAVVSFGAEVIADGHVHVYAPLRGRAIAGARGDRSARIFSTCMEPQLVSIAGYYRTAELPLAAEVLGKPAQVRLEGEKLLVDPIKN
jgi:septum site-determining protein MinC